MRLPANPSKGLIAGVYGAARLALRSSMTGRYVAIYVHDPAPEMRLTRLRDVVVDMWGKGAVKVGLEVLRR